MSRRPEVFVSKLAAAQRQLDAAIRMTFHQEDELAIYTVAAAAHRVLRDVLNKRGRSAGAEAIRDSFRGMANALVQDKLPDGHRDFFERQEFWPTVLALAEQIRHGGGDTLRVDSAPGFDRTFWNWQTEVANFLKHADHDSSSTISHTKIDTTHLICSACMTYGQLMGGLTIEMEVYLASQLAGDNGPSLQGHIEAMRLWLRDVPEAQRGSACICLVDELKQAQPSPRMPRSS